PASWPQGMRSLANLIDRHGEWPLTNGNEITPLFNGDEAYPEMLAAIDAAEESVWLQTYIFDREGPGSEFADALERAFARGVDVRVIIDDASRFHARSPVERLLRRKGIARTSFTPRRWWLRLLTINLRNHRKILVIDGKVGFTGGMNILPGHRLNDDPKTPVSDVHFSVTGPVVRQLLAVFVEDWRFSANEVLPIPNLAEHAKNTGAWACGIPDGPDEDYNKLATVFAGALACSQDSIWIASPYFLPNETLNHQLILAAQRGVEIRILVPANNNHAIVKWASESYYATLLAAGCRIIETTGDFDHSKLMVIDDFFFSIGSANWDDRSLRLNYEFNVVGFDFDLSAEMIKAMRDRQDNIGTRITPEAVAEWSYLRQLRNRVVRLATPYL
ncbi:MAG: phospholipase D-like domain-containing protein, partial [Verrucomicrobiota bacterium]